MKATVACVAVMLILGSNRPLVSEVNSTEDSLAVNGTVPYDQDLDVATTSPFL